MDFNEPIESRHIFINDISNDITTSDLRNLFSSCGWVTNIEIDTNELNKHFAFITFKSSQGVQSAISKFTTTILHNTTLFCIRRTELEQMRQNRINAARCRLRIDNIPHDQQISYQDLRREIEKLSQRPVTDFRHNNNNYYCYVGYNTPKDAENAKSSLKNAICRGKTLKAQFKHEHGFMSIMEQSQRTLYVQHIPPNTSIGNFKTIFEQYGRVKKFILPTESQPNRLDGYAFIEYFWKEDCNKADDMTQNLVIDGVQIEVQTAISTKLMNDVIYTIMVQDVLKNNDNTTDKIQTLKSELLTYFSKPVANMVAIHTIREWERENLLIFGYIAKMDKMMSFDVINIIITYFCEGCYKCDHGYEWEEKIDDMVKNMERMHYEKGKQFEYLENSVMAIGFERVDAISITTDIIIRNFGNTAAELYLHK